MEWAILIALLNNAAQLLVLSVVYEVTYFLPATHQRMRSIFSGIFIALICIAIMSMPFTLQPGVIYDTRSILISVTALIFGAVPTIITAVAAAVYRLGLGGTGTLPGLAVITTSALIGLAWRRWIYPKSIKWRWVSVYIMSICVHLTMLTCMLLLPYPESLNVIRAIALPVMVIYPIGSVILNLLLIRQQELRQAKEQLKQSEERFRLLFEKAPLGYQSLDENGNFIEVNQQWLDTFGYSREEVIGKWFGDFLPANYLEAFKRNFPLFKSKGQTQIEFEMLGKNEKKISISFEGRIGYDADGEFKQTHCILQDVTQRKVAEEALRLSEEKYRKITENTSDVIWTVDLNLNTTFVSPSIERLVGESVQAHLSRPMEQKFPPESMKKIQELLVDELEQDAYRDKKRTRLIELEHYRADGSSLWLEMNVSIIRDENEQIIGFQGVSRDITALKKMQEELHYLVEHDELTGLFNRRRYEKEIERLDVKEQLPLSIIIADINGLKLINDSFGPAEGDKIIVESANLIRSCCQKDEILFRTGGDEFSILLPKTDLPTALKVLMNIQAAAEQYNSSVHSEAYFVNLSLGADTKESVEMDFKLVSKRAADYMNQRKLLEKNSSYSAILDSIKATMFEKSHETEEHSERMSQLSREVGLKLKLSQLELDHIELLAKLHDIGKVGIPERILKKPGKLSEEEWVEMKKHPEIGYRIAMSSPNLAPIAVYILHHHERWDGNGYPQNLKGEEIPLISRIVGVVDAYDAMTEDRIYRKALTHDEAVEELKRCSATQFDPQVVEVFIQIIERK